MARAVRKMYRFAVYGRSGSGKSCLLGAMSLVGASSRALTCELLPVEVPEPPQHPQGPMSEQEREELGLHNGWKWIREVQEKLRCGEVPKPNPAEFGPAPPMLDFRIGDPQQGDRLVRLIDYSGELINPDMEHDPESYVRKLREYLSQSDGFLILAEIPKNNSDFASRTLHLQRLREAFKSLLESKDDALQTPACIMLTKWDRYSEIEHANPSAELCKLETYLHEHRELQSLIHSIGNALAPQNTALKTAENPQPDFSVDAQETSAITASSSVGVSSLPSESPRPPEDQQPVRTIDVPASQENKDQWGLPIGNVWVFPASAFGAAAEKDGQEVPKGILQPFGILEPFIWLAQRRDALDVVAMQQACSGHVRWVWLPFGFFSRSHRLLQNRTTELSSRIPPSSPLARPLAQVRRNLFWARWASIISTVLMFLLMLSSLGTTLWSRFRYLEFAHWQSVVENPASTAELLKQARDFFDGYTQTWWNGLFVPSKQEAKHWRAQADSKIDEILWKDVQTAVPYSEEQVQRAEKYLEDMPDGKHADETRNIVAEGTKRQQERQNSQWVAERRQELATATTASQVAELLEKLHKGFPHPESVSQTQKQQLEQLRSQAEAKWAELEWPEFQKKYRENMDAGAFQDAAHLLATRQPRDERWQKLIREFLAEIAQKSKSRISGHLQDAKFEDARQEWDKAEMALMQLQSAVRATEPATADSVLETLRKLQPEQRRIDQAHDRFLYNKVRNQPTLQACQEYLEKAPLKTMEKAVQAYADYLKALENPLDVTVEIKIFWHENYHPDGWPDRGENYIQVYIDDTQVFQSKEPIAENPDNLSGEVGTFQISKKRRHDRVTIKVKIVEDDSLMSGFDDDGGVGQQECSLEELKKGIRIPLRPQDGSNFENRADLVITAGWPSEPELPLWRE
jgi:hypothetical protein